MCLPLVKPITSDRMLLRRTMVSQLIWHERIETTVPRAKELRKVADRMVTLGKEVRLCESKCTLEQSCSSAV